MFLQIQGERKHIGQIVCIIAVFWLAILSLALQFFTLGRFQAIFGFWHLHEANFRLDAPAITLFLQFLLLGHYNTPCIACNYCLLEYLLKIQRCTWRKSAFTIGQQKLTCIHHIVQFYEFWFQLRHSCGGFQIILRTTG